MSTGSPVGESASLERYASSRRSDYCHALAARSFFELGLRCFQGTSQIATPPAQTPARQRFGCSELGRSAACRRTPRRVEQIPIGKHSPRRLESAGAAHPGSSGCMNSCARRSSFAACMPSCSEFSAASRAPDYVHAGPLLCDGRWPVERIAECASALHTSGGSTPCATLHRKDRSGLECSRSGYPRSAIAKSAARLPPRRSGKCFQGCRGFRIRRYSRDARIYLAQLIRSDAHGREGKRLSFWGFKPQGETLGDPSQTH